MVGHYAPRLSVRRALYRKLSEKVQTELAAANSVADEVLSTMTTIKARDARTSTALRLRLMERL